MSGHGKSRSGTHQSLCSCLKYSSAGWKIVAYDQTGKGHRTALKDEGRFAEWLNSGGHKHFDWGSPDFVKAHTQGGTQHTEDVVVITTGGQINFSCKYAGGGINNHSHTYKNTSRIITQLKRSGSPIVQPIIKLEEFRDAEVLRIPNPVARRANRDTYSSMMRAACSETRDNLTTELVTEIFTGSMKHSLEMDYVVIYDGVTEEYNWYKPEHHPAISALNEGCEIALVPKAKGSESASIVLITEYGQQIGLGLRLRVKHNNGVSDLFKMGSQNSGSFVTTIQQDPGSVASILDAIKSQGNLGRAGLYDL